MPYRISNELFPICEFRALALSKCLLVAARGNCNIEVARSDGIEADDFFIVFTAALLAAENLAEFGMNILILDLTVACHKGDSADQTMLDYFPIIYNDLAGLADTVVGNFEVSHIHQQAALLEPAGVDDRLVGQSNTDNDIALASGLFGALHGNNRQAGILP